MPDLTRIQEIWKDRHQGRETLDLAGEDNARQSFHARVSLRPQDTGSYHANFLGKVESILGNAEKFTVFKNLLPYPLPSTELISEASDEWNKIFYAKDRSIELHLSDDSQLSELEAFLDNIALDQFIEQDVFTKAKQAVNTLAVVDSRVITAADGSTSSQPYVYLLDAGQCTYIQEGEKNRVDALAYTTGSMEKKNQKLYVIDTEHYWSFTADGETLTLIAQNPHGLGFCPATFIWHDVIDKGVGVRRFNAVIESLARMDQYVMAEVFGSHTDLYAAFPILWSYTKQCEYQDPAGNRCFEGYVNFTNERGVEVSQLCPACAKKEYVGPGEHLLVDVPQSPDDKLIGQPAGFINAERNILDYNVEKTERLRASIFRFLSGFDKSTDGKGTKQYNQEQIGSMNETRQAVLRYWAENFQITHKFLLDTIGRLLYGEDYLGSSVNYGEDWLLADMNTATAEYQAAKDAGLPQYLVGLKRRTIEQLHARVSPSAAQRIQILSELEPYVDVPLSLMQPDTDAYELKANFAAYIARFERENGDIVRFGRLISYEKKIILIQQTLDSYVSKQRMVREPRPQEGVPANPRMDGGQTPRNRITKNAGVPVGENAPA